eukprot:6207182-Pleurochrysis_carterae.AAC.3
MSAIIITRARAPSAVLWVSLGRPRPETFRWRRRCKAAVAAYRGLLGARAAASSSARSWRGRCVADVRAF